MLETAHCALPAKTQRVFSELAKHRRNKLGLTAPLVPFRKVGKVGEPLKTDGRKLRSRLKKKGKGQGRSSLGAKAAGSGVGYGTKGPRTSRRFWAAVHRWISPIQPPMVFVTEISFVFPRDFLGNQLPCCKQSNLNLVALLSFNL